MLIGGREVAMIFADVRLPGATPQDLPAHSQRDPSPRSQSQDETL
jgi:hypothetical protein